MIDASHIEASQPGARFRVGQACHGDQGQWSVEWNTRRNVSLTPGQLMGSFGIVCGFSLAVAGFFWLQGVHMVLPFAGLELAGIATALLIHARHVGDAERIALCAGHLTIDRETGGAVEHIEFETRRVRVEPLEGRQALVRLSGQGRQVAIGRHLQPHLRPQLADELRRAIRLAR